ncbi:MAG: hypothetical protein Q7S22_06595 [Candidatus Micrarchaeota archaeon]|nr:hypothetical protein [Candidatus Micrarchaeota archaeon]
MINSFTIPVLALGAILGGIIIALVNMFGQTTHNPKLSLWSKTEVVQLFTSLVATILILQGVNIYCSINLLSVVNLFTTGTTITAPASSVTLFGGAELYLKQSALFNKELLSITRYHLGAYNILEGRYLSRCAEDDGANILLCMFGGFVGAGGASHTQAPESGYSTVSSGLFLSFNTQMFSYLSSLNYLFILRYIFSGMVLFFLPLGTFIRSIPYLRGLGSLLIAVSASFLFIYPLVLSIFYIDFMAGDLSVLKPPIPQDYINDDFGIDTADSFAFFNKEIHDDIFNKGGSQEKQIIELTGNGFIIGVFIPSIAMLAAIASSVYLSRLLGEEIDLSRIVQMV